MAICKEGDEEQKLTYSFDTKFLLHPNSCLCLRRHQDGWLRLADCTDENDWYKWSISGNNIINLKTSKCIASYDGNFPYEETCDDQNDNQNWNLQCKSKHKFD